jgi:ligand-binding sensor domain-containing protein
LNYLAETTRHTVHFVQTKKRSLSYPIYFLVLTLVYCASCNGQVKTTLSGDSVRAPRTISTGHPKIVKTQGSNVYANTRCGLQDKAGNLWFGTLREGVYRYDGKSFTQFTVKDGLSHNSVYSILEDRTGFIWIGTDSGLCRYDGKTITSIPIAVSSGRYFSLSVSPTNTPAASIQVWSIMQDKGGTLWFGTSEGMYCYNGTSFSRFLDNDNVVNNSGLHLRMVDCILEDKKGNIWFGSGMPPGMEGLCSYDGKSITTFKPNGAGWIRYMVEDKHGNIWLGTRNQGVWLYDGKAFARFTEKEGIGTPLLVDKAGNVWFGGQEHENGFEGDGGVWCYDGKAFRNYGTKDGLGNYSVWCIVEDRSGYIWFGTRNNGLYRFDGKSFTSFSD